MASITLHPTDRALPPALWRRKAPIILIVSVLIALLTTLIINLQRAERSARLPLRQLTLATVSRSVFHDDMPLRAHVRPRNTVYLDAQAGGRVERVLARAGDMVAEGQVLVELSNSQWQLDVLEREARIVESVSQLESYQTQLEQNRIANQRAAALITYDIVRLRRSLDRRRSLEAGGMEPVEKLDQLRDELEYNQVLQPLQQESNVRQDQLRTEQLPQIRTQLQALQQDLQMTHEQLDKLLVRAPATGRLTSLNAEVGENHTAGTRFGEVTPDQGYKLTASVDEYFLGRVRPGQPASVPIRDQVSALKVERVYPQVKNGSFEVDLAFDAAPPDLTPGETVQGRLTLGSDHPALILASGPFMDQTAGAYAFVLDAHKRTAVRRRITVGRRNADQLEITGGLQEGDIVLISSYEHLERFDRLDITG